MPTLLERQHELAVLHEAVAAAAARRGSVVEVAGEAGMGKSALLETWRAEASTEVHEFVGWCDDLLTKRALGPLRDIARVAGGAVATAVADLDTGSVLDALLTVLDDPLCPTVLVLEDVHWADEATLDVVRYVGRRIERLPAVLVITYREDELGSDHPLLSVLGALRGPVHRLSLRPLSARAVAQLTDGLDVDPDEVRRVTAGTRSSSPRSREVSTSSRPASPRRCELGRSPCRQGPVRRSSCCRSYRAEPTTGWWPRCSSIPPISPSPKHAAC